MVNYFLDADHAYLRGMGVDPGKLPTAKKWRQILLEDFVRPIEDKRFYYVIWELDDVPVGHSNLNKINYAQEAFMHLHLWQSQNRHTGHGTQFIQQSLACYFEKFHLQRLFCEPYALNSSPNRALPKAGFEFVKTHEPEPGWINFQHPVNRWVITQDMWLQRMTVKKSEARL